MYIYIYIYNHFNRLENYKVISLMLQICFMVTCKITLPIIRHYCKESQQVHVEYIKFSL